MINGVRMYAIYEVGPSPKKFVVREWRVSERGIFVGVTASLHDKLADARKAVPARHIPVPQIDGDDVVLREVWT